MDSKYGTASFWIPPVAGILITPLCLLIVLSSAGVGHGSYAPMMLLYPYSLGLLISQFAFGIDSVFSDICVGLAIIVGIIQFPLYGLVIGFANATQLWYFVIGKFLVFLHVGLVALLILISLVAGAVSFFI